MHNQFINLGNLLEIIVQHLLTEKKDLSWLSGWVSPSESTSICNAYWREPTMNYNIKLSNVMIH